MNVGLDKRPQASGAAQVFGTYEPDMVLLGL